MSFHKTEAYPVSKRRDDGDHILIRNGLKNPEERWRDIASFKYHTIVYG